jgi:hypothetical protein
MVKKSKMGSGRVVPVDLTAKHSIVRVNLSPRQVLSLKKGGAITVKAITDDGSHELTLPDIDVKKLLTKLNRGVGARVSLNGGSVESVFRDMGKYVQPLSDAAIDRGRRELGSGMRKRGGGPFDFLDPRKNGAQQFFTQTLPSELIHQGIPVAGQAIGSMVGNATGNPLLGMAGSQVGKYAGQKIANRVGRATGRGLMDVGVSIAKSVGKRVAKKVVSVAAKKAKDLATRAIDTAESGAKEFIGEGIFPAGVGGGIYPAGVNLRRGGGVEDPIQLGSPYIQVNSPAFHPFKPTYNPFASNSAVQRMPKSGGMIVRV